MSTQYQVNIQMSQSTVQALLQSGFSLYAFAAVRAPVGGGAPLVWFQTTQFYSNTPLSWSADYQAYTSMSQIFPNATIVQNFAAPIALGQTLNVTSPGGTGQVSGGGAPQAISIVNQTSATFACGTSQADPNGNSSPVCAFPLYPQAMDAITPLPQVLLMFATVQTSPGTVVEQAFAPGILVNLAGSPMQTVSFDINAGWSCGGGNCTNVSPGQALTPILIQ